MSASLEPPVRVYAIPTGDDIILAVLSSDAGSLGPVLQNSDALIGTLTFD